MFKKEIEKLKEQKKIIKTDEGFNFNNGENRISIGFYGKRKGYFKNQTFFNQINIGIYNHGAVINCILYDVRMIVYDKMLSFEGLNDEINIELIEE